MKNLKIKFGLFSLLAVLAVSVFLTSCQQEEIIEMATVQQVEDRTSETMIMPFGIATDTEEIRKNYIENASPELLTKMAENGRVAYYLTSINKLEEAATQMSYGDFFCDVNLISILTEAEIAALQNYDLSTTSNNIELRCSSWEGTGECEWRRIGYYWERCCKFTRDCGWKFWASETKWECS